MISSLSFACPSSLRIPTARRSHRCVAAATTLSFPSSASPYDVLGVGVGATGGEIKAAYRRLARACHPDAVASELKRVSADEFMRVEAAYETLSDPDKRAEYDSAILSVRTEAAARSYCGYVRRRNWETDQCW